MRSRQIRIERAAVAAAAAVAGAAVAVAAAACAEATPADEPARAQVAATAAAAAAAAATTTATATPAAPACDPTLPPAACARGPVRRCASPTDRDRVGEWRYALIAPLFAAAQDVTRDELVAAWRGALASPTSSPRPAVSIAATAETAAALAPLLGSGAPAPLAPGERPALDATRWAIVPAESLVPAWSVISVDGRHPLDPAPDSALAIPLCAPGGAGGGAVRNIDPARLTTIAMTGTTALTRGTARMIDRMGLAHPTRDVEPWLRANDFVHISNEVSLVPHCDPAKAPSRMSFCSRESYIKVLEDSHAKIIELTGSHLTDYGRRWFEHTLDLYRQRGWRWFGGGRDQLEGTAPLVIEHRGNRIGFLGCNKVYTGEVITEGPGPAACDLDRMIWQVGDLRRRGIVPVVAIQHEEVYEHDPPASVVADFRRFAEAGAAMVFGSQAHTAHPWEVHHGAFVHYGAGNFYFDQEFRHTAEGVADRLYFHDNRLISVGRLFTKVEDNGRPRPMTAGERARFLDELTACLGKLRRARPWDAPRLPEASPRPDSFLIGKQQQLLTVVAPERLEEARTYPLVIDLVGGHRDEAAYVARRRSPKARVPERFAAGAIELMTAKYPIDPDRVFVRRADGKPPAKQPPP